MLLNAGRKSTMPFPFEVQFPEVEERIDFYVDRVFECLETEFLIVPRGDGFIEYEVFDAGYEALKLATDGFEAMAPEAILPVVFERPITLFERPITLVVLRCILGLTSPEWAGVASRHIEGSIPQGAARSLDRDIRMRPDQPLPREGVTAGRVRKLVEAACRMIDEDVPAASPTSLHRLDKVDTRTGRVSLQAAARLGVPYSMLLYERFLGRPFASHRDSVSELVGNIVENAIEAVLSRADVSFRKTARVERLPGFDQVPDFIVPSEHNPKIVIEAKLSEDDGTARDKVTRVQHLATLARQGRPDAHPRYELIACIAGRGFGVRREDMKKLLIATRGKVFTLQKHPGSD